MSATPTSNPVTAGMLVIGDEILSGRTKDKNIGTVADFCTEMGIELREVRVVADETDDIVAAINALRTRYTHVFTTGGIGPTHDDITADAVAMAFEVALPINDEAREIIETRLRKVNVEINPSVLRMARIPEGASLIANPVSGAPGFRMGNVHVMAGVPKIMQAMLNEIAKTLTSGRKMLSRELPCGVGESTVSTGLGEIQTEYPAVKIGSYPQMVNPQRDPDVAPVYAYIALRSTNEALLDEATAKVKALIDRLHAEKGITLSEEPKP